MLSSRPVSPSVTGCSPFLLLHVHPCLHSCGDAVCQAVLGLQRDNGNCLINDEWKAGRPASQPARAAGRIARHGCTDEPAADQGAARRAQPLPHAGLGQEGPRTGLLLWYTLPQMKPACQQTTRPRLAGSCMALPCAPPLLDGRRVLAARVPAAMKVQSLACTPASRT